MDAITLLKKDHREVEALFAELEDLGERANVSRAKLFSKIDEALTLHAKVEETVFYPALKKASRNNTEERDEVLEAYEEHAIVKTLLGELEALEPSDETYRPKLKVLMESVKHHVKEEEGPLFRTARELLGKDQLNQIGERNEEMKAGRQRVGV